MTDTRPSRPRRSDTGLMRPTRPCPHDFRERFLELGQTKEIEEHYRTNWRCITRWIEECGGDDLRAARSQATGCPLRPHRRSDKARRYVLGLRLNGARRDTRGIQNDG